MTTRTIRKPQKFPIVKCPNCLNDVILSLEFWHTECETREMTNEEYEEFAATYYLYADNYVPEGFTLPVMSSAPPENEEQMEFKGQTDDEYLSNVAPFWISSKNGGFHGEKDGVMMVVKQTRDRKWSCGGYESAVENGAQILTWKRGFPTEVAAQKNILKRLEMRNR